MDMDIPQIERERAERVAANLVAMADLGLNIVADDKPRNKPVSRKPKKVKAADAEPAVPTRRSARERPAVSYSEDAVTAALPRRSRGPGAARELDEAELERVLGGVTSTSGDADPTRRRSRGAIDSGRGVRIQGGKIYDSAFGVTCHWCRQKTLESSVTCCNATCGGGRRLPTTFCSKCLLNRHGEDFEAARASGAWACPQCRGSCGPGCTRCCNCGPCRKKAGLEPTHQILRDARAVGFSNVHDYLVHLVTGETAEEIAGRKGNHAWGAWLGMPQGGAACDGRCAAAAGEPSGALKAAVEGVVVAQASAGMMTCGAGTLATVEDPAAAAAPAERADAAAAPAHAARKASRKGASRYAKRAKTSDAAQLPAGDVPEAPAACSALITAPAVPTLPSRKPSSTSGQTAGQEQEVATAAAAVVTEAAAVVAEAAAVVTEAAGASAAGDVAKASKLPRKKLQQQQPAVRRSTRGSCAAGPAGASTAAAAAPPDGTATGVAGFFPVVKRYRAEEAGKSKAAGVGLSAGPQMAMGAAPPAIGVC